MVQELACSLWPLCGLECSVDEVSGVCGLASADGRIGEYL